MKSPFLSGLLAALLLTPAWANNHTNPQVNQGMASNLACGILVQGPAGSPIRIKGPNNQTAAPVAFSNTAFPTTPNFELPALFPNGSHPAGGRPAKWQLVDLNAISTGNDLIAPINTAGQLQLGNRWLAACASVTNATKGEPFQGNLIRRRTAMTTRRSTPGSDLLSYYYDVNAGPARNLRNTVVMEQECEAIGYGSTSTEDIEGLDFALGVVSHGQGTSSVLFGGLDTFYFSVTKDSADELNLYYPMEFALDQQGSNWVPVSEATVYSVTLSGGVWGTPQEYRTKQELNLENGDDIDAIAVRPNGPMIFSLVFNPAKKDRSQLFIYDPAVSSTVFELVDSENQRLDITLGVKNTIINNDDTEDIDAVSILDPEVHVFDSHMGIAGEWPGELFPATMGIAMTRYFEGANERLRVQITGYGSAGPGPGTLTFLFGIYNNTPFNERWEYLPTFDVPRPAGASVFELPPYAVPNLPGIYTLGCAAAMFTPDPGAGAPLEPSFSFFTIWDL